MDTQSPEALFRNMPVVTRAIMVATFGVTLTTVLGLFNPTYIILDWVLVSKKLHLWRLVTDYLFVGGFSINWVFHMYFFVTFSTRLESYHSLSRTQTNRGSYLYFLFIQMMLLDFMSIILSYPHGRPILAPALSFSIIYYWSKKEPLAPVGLWGFTLAAWQFPYALFVLDLIMGQSILHNVMGLITGHTYHFLRDILPIEKNIDVFGKTPSFFAYLTEKLDFMSNNIQQRPSTGTFSSSQTATTAQSGTNRQSGTSASNQTSNGIFSLFTTNSSNNNSANNTSHQFPGRGYRLGGNHSE